MEEEARLTLGHAVRRPAVSRDLASIIRSHFVPSNGVELELPPRSSRPSRLRSSRSGPMILPDANVVSELMRPAPEPTVPAWTASHPSHLLLALPVV